MLKSEFSIINDMHLKRTITKLPESESGEKKETSCLCLLTLRRRNAKVLAAIQPNQITP
jgi:hypothetical protein